MPWKGNTAIKKTNENMLKRDSLPGKPQNILERPKLIYNHFRDSNDNLHAQNLTQTISTKINKTLTIQINATEQDFRMLFGVYNLCFFLTDQTGPGGEKRD